MKRSEMIKFIHWYINDQLFTTNEDGSGDFDEECSIDLLDHLEEKGMLPPKATFKKECFLDSGASSGFLEWFDNKWEPED